MIAVLKVLMQVVAILVTSHMYEINKRLSCSYSLSLAFFLYIRDVPAAFSSSSLFTKKVCLDGFDFLLSEMK
jgi:hypothetical protein